MIESVTIYPDGANGPEAEVTANVADLVAYATNDNAAPMGGVCSSMTVVAGARFECEGQYLRRVGDSSQKLITMPFIAIFIAVSFEELRIMCQVLETDGNPWVLARQILTPISTEMLRIHRLATVCAGTERLELLTTFSNRAQARRDRQ